MHEATEIDILSESFFENPYPTFERLRAEAPVYFCEPLQSFILSRYGDVEALVKDSSFSSRRSAELLGALGMLTDDEASRKMSETWSRVVFFQDPPRHTLIRQMIMKEFSPAILEPVRPTIAAIVDRALEKARSDGSMEIVAEFAEPIAINTLAELFAIPVVDRPKFIQWSIDVLKPAGAGVGSDDAKRTVRNSSNAMVDYIANLVEERRKAPGDDLVSRFVMTEGESPDLAGEATIQSFQMVGAGFVTSMNQIANATLMLLKHPDELQKLRENPRLLKGALEETLRYEPSILSINRLCVKDTEIQGVKISKGQFVYAMTAAANRDPLLFADADRFDITRALNRHVTFGVGVHYCPGASLIRFELEEAICGLLTLPRWELSDKPVDYKGSNLQDRGPSSLHVRFPQA